MFCFTSQMVMEDDNVESIMEETADIVEDVKEMTYLDVDYIADILDKTVNVKKITRKVRDSLGIANTKKEYLNTMEYLMSYCFV